MRSFLIAGLLGIAFLTACGGSGGGGGPTPTPTPTSTTPAVVQTITSGITPAASLYQAVVGPDARIWFTEFTTNNLAAVTVTGTVTEYPLGSGAQPDGITVGADGNLWTGGFNGTIFRVNTSGSITGSYADPGGHIAALVLGPDGNVWFTDYGNDTVGKITTTGAITTFSTTPLGAQPSGIAKGPDNNLWVTDAYGSIIKVTTAGAMTQYKTGLTAGGSPQFITAASDGNLYFTEAFFSSSKSDRIGKIAPGGAIAEFGTLAPNTYPNIITTGADGNVYFTEYDKPNLGKVTLATQAVTEYPLGLTDGSAIVNGPDNDLWVGQRQTIAKISY